MLSSECNEKMEDIIWELPITMVFKSIALLYGMKTGETVLNHKEREVIKRQQKAFMELTNG